VTGRNRSAAVHKDWYSSSVRSISAAATLLSSCPTLDAPGMATTPGRRMAQASAIWAGVAECASATSRRAAIRSPARSRFSGRNSGLAARRLLPGRLSRWYRPESSPWASGL
jgi:hypothetical protein